MRPAVKSSPRSQVKSQARIRTQKFTGNCACRQVPKETGQCAAAAGFGRVFEARGGIGDAYLDACSSASAEVRGVIGRSASREWLFAGFPVAHVGRVSVVFVPFAGGHVMRQWWEAPFQQDVGPSYRFASAGLGGVFEARRGIGDAYADACSSASAEVRGVIGRSASREWLFAGFPVAHVGRVSVVFVPFAGGHVMRQWWEAPFQQDVGPSYRFASVAAWNFRGF